MAATIRTEVDLMPNLRRKQRKRMREVEAKSGRFTGTFSEPSTVGNAMRREETGEGRR